MEKYWIILFLVLAVKPLSAVADDMQDYNEAYSICSPAAHSLTRQACNYSVVFERAYLDCMQNNGYGEESQAKGGNYYKSYMESYNQCYSAADYTAQKHCHYSTSYNKYYNGCMAEYGFNDLGERIAPSAGKPAKGEGFRFNF